MVSSAPITSAQAQTSGLGFTGQSVRRVEDERLLLGHGTYVADVLPDGVLHAAFLRSPFPHATIDAINVAAARRLPGVVAVFTGAEINDVSNPFPPFLMIPGSYTPLFNAMSADKVRHVGDPVALVVAESRYIAEDALELIEVDYTDLPAVASIDVALKASSEPLWDKAKSNVIVDAIDSYGDVDRVFSSADRVITETFRCHRQSNQPMETRGSVVEVDSATGHLTLHNTSQAPHLLKWAVAAVTTNVNGFTSLVSFLKNERRRKAFFQTAKRFSIDIGGAFGSKGPVAREDIALVVAAQKLGRSVQWIEDRVENLIDGGQAREEDFTMSIAVDNDGTLRGMKCDMVIDQGAYPGFPIGVSLIKQLMKVYMPGAYRFEAFELRSRIVTTNKGKYVPYRGPWANETWARERMIDVVASELDMSPSALRVQNMYGADELPKDMITGPTMDVTMSLKGTLERAIELIDMEQFAADRAQAEARGPQTWSLALRASTKPLPASPEDIDISDGNIHVAGVPARGLTYRDVAAEAASRKRIVDGPVFEVRKSYAGHGDGGWSVSTHVAIVDLDMETGVASFPRYLVVEDCGPIINPAIVDGQVRGAVAQGIGAVFYENALYDADGNPQATTYMDYLVPTAMEIPPIEIEHLQTLSPGENDHRGVGEGGFIGAPAALTNAVEDALGTRITTQYLPPTTILELAGVIDPD
ncbi:Caffeine dehydrogenase subunit alpha [Nymphon striatum]|nr:Caffeine dehydrogenase subunit alpha [Nymphon striatum]